LQKLEEQEQLKQQLQKGLRTPSPSKQSRASNGGTGAGAGASASAGAVPGTVTSSVFSPTDLSSASLLQLDLASPAKTAGAGTKVRPFGVSGGSSSGFSSAFSTIPPGGAGAGGGAGLGSASKRSALGASGTSGAATTGGAGGGWNSSTKPVYNDGAPIPPVLRSSSAGVSASAATATASKIGSGSFGGGGGGGGFIDIMGTGGPMGAGGAGGVSSTAAAGFDDYGEHFDAHLQHELEHEHHLQEVCDKVHETEYHYNPNAGSSRFDKLGIKYLKKKHTPVRVSIVDASIPSDTKHSEAMAGIVEAFAQVSFPHVAPIGASVPMSSMYQHYMPLRSQSPYSVTAGEGGALSGVAGASPTSPSQSQSQSQINSMSQSKSQVQSKSPAKSPAAAAATPSSLQGLSQSRSRQEGRAALTRQSSQLALHSPVYSSNSNSNSGYNSNSNSNSSRVGNGRRSDSGAGGDSPEQQVEESGSESDNEAEEEGEGETDKEDQQLQPPATGAGTGAEAVTSSIDVLNALYDEVVDSQQGEVLQNFASNIVLLFRRLKENTRSHSGATDSVLSLRIARTSLCKLGLIGTKGSGAKRAAAVAGFGEFSSYDVDVVLTHLGVKQLSVFGFALAITLCGEKALRLQPTTAATTPTRTTSGPVGSDVSVSGSVGGSRPTSPWSSRRSLTSTYGGGSGVGGSSGGDDFHSGNTLTYLQVAEDLNARVVKQIEDINMENYTHSVTNPLYDCFELTVPAKAAVVKLLESERRVLFIIYEAYLPILSAKKNNSWAMSSKPISGGGYGGSGGHNSNSVVPHGDIHAALAMPPSTPGLLTFGSVVSFARDFELMPELFSRLQLLEIFNSVLFATHSDEEREGEAATGRRAVADVQMAHHPSAVAAVGNRSGVGASVNAQQQQNERDSISFPQVCGLSFNTFPTTFYFLCCLVYFYYNA
jgi:hypothetical protein